MLIFLIRISQRWHFSYATVSMLLDVLVAMVPYGGMTGWQRQCMQDSVAIPPLFLFFSSHTHTHTHTHTRARARYPREFRRKLLPGRPKVAEFLRRWKSLTRATQQRILSLGDSALSPSFDNAYRSVASPKETSTGSSDTMMFAYSF